METTAKLVSKALATATQEPPTKASHPTIATLEKWAGFQTLGEPQLEDMLTATWRFIAGIKAEPVPMLGEFRKPQGRWLSLLGTSGAGKTMLSKFVWNWWCTQGRRCLCPVSGAETWRHGRWLSWKSFVENSKPSLPHEQWQDLREAWLVIIDDFGSAHDPSGYATDLLLGILQSRDKRWTLLTSNLSAEAVQKRDGRIASRLIRHGSEVVDVNVIDWNLRGEK